MTSLPVMENPPRAFNAESTKALFDAVGHPPPEIARILESARAKLAEIDGDTRYTAEHRQGMRRDAIEAARRSFDAAHETHRDTSLRTLKTEEGRLRAALNNEPAVLELGASDNDRVRLLQQEQRVANVQGRIDLDIRELDSATELAEVLDVFEEAESAGGEVMRRTGRYAVRAAEALLKVRRGGAAGQPHTAAEPDARLVADMRGRYADWSKAKPV